MPYIVYKISNTENDKIYIGVTSQRVEVRFKQHQYAAKRGIRTKFYDAMRDVGCDKFRIETLKSDVPKDEILVEEFIAIGSYDSFNSGYNMNPGGSGLIEHRKESIEKMSKNNHWNGKPRTGELNPMFNRKHSEETKKLISDRRKERGSLPTHTEPHSEEAKKKISEANKGKPGWNTGIPMSEETKQKLRESLKDRVPKYKKYLITFPDGHTEIIEKLKEFCSNLEISYYSMQNLALGRQQGPYRNYYCTEYKSDKYV